MSTTKSATVPCSQHNHASWLLFFPLLLCVGGCDMIVSDDWKETEVKRVTSPDKRFDLVSYKAAGGATSGIYNKMYLMPVGEKDRVHGQLVLETKGTEPIPVKWLPDGRAIFLTRGRRVDHFSNYGYISHGNDMPSEVRFVLK